MPAPLRAVAISIVISALIGCSSSTASRPEPTGTPSTTTTTPDVTPSFTSAPPTFSPPPDLPSGLPTSYDGDVASAEVPAAELVPEGTEVTGVWFGTTAEGEAIAVAWQVPGDDPFRLARGIAIWKRFDDEGLPWRAVAGRTYPSRRGVLGISSLVADVTGDAWDDLLVRADTGGSGACATYSVWDLATAMEVYTSDLCDGRVDPSADPVGLTLVESVYEPGDPHCCPSAMRKTVLTYSGAGTWEVVSQETEEL